MRRRLAALSLAAALASPALVTPALVPPALAQKGAGTPPATLPVGPRIPQPEYRPAPTPDPDRGDGAVALDLGEPHDRLFWSVEGGEIWVRGRTYKASAGPDGFAFYPFLGADAPRTWPVALRLASATAGGDALPLAVPARASRAGERLVLDRGAVEVTYDVALGSVEQSFHLMAPAAGPIVLDVALETDLAVAPDGEGLRFSGPRGGVLYSGAVAFDGAGHRTAVPVTLAGSVLRLTVPADFVAEAEGRITVDPILNTYTLQAGTADRYDDTDIAYDATTATYLVGVVERFATGDSDIALIAHDVQGNVQGTMSGFFSNDDMSDVSIANQNADDVCLVVGTMTPNVPGSDRDVLGRIIDMQTGSSGPVLSIAVTSDNEFEPDVGGNGTTNPDGRFLFVWSQDLTTGVPQTHMRRVSVDGTMGAPFLLAQNPNELQFDPAVSKSVGDAGDVNFWTVVAGCNPLGVGGNSIKAIQVNADAQSVLAPAAELVTFPPTEIPSNPDVSTALLLPDPTGTTTSPTYLVSYDTTGNDEDIHLTVAQGQNARITRELGRLEHADLDLDPVGATLAVTADDFVVAYSEEEPGSAGVRSYATTLDVIEGAVIAINEPRLLLQAGADGLNSRVNLASRYDAGLVGSSWVGAAWTEDDGGWRLEGARIAVAFRTSIGAHYCYGQPNSTGERGFIGVYGDRGTSTNKTVLASGLPPQQFCLLGTGTLPAQINPVPNSQGTLCIAGAVGRFNNQIALIAPDGTAQVSVDPQMIPTPTAFVAAMAGETRGFQFWHRDVGANGTPTSNFTSGAAVTFR